MYSPAFCLRQKRIRLQEVAFLKRIYSRIIIPIWKKINFQKIEFKEFRKIQPLVGFDSQKISEKICTLLNFKYQNIRKQNERR
jgi:hypothetical protein